MFRVAVLVGSPRANSSNLKLAKALEKLATGKLEFHYVITNIESSIASSDRDLMCADADLVDDTRARERVLKIILDEWELTRSMLDRLRGGAMASRST